jgi:hypothetical protein
MGFIIALPEAAATTGRAQVLTVVHTSITAFPVGLAVVVPIGLAVVAPTGLAVAVITSPVEATTTITISGGIARLDWQSEPMSTACLRIAFMKSMAA